MWLIYSPAIPNRKPAIEQLIPNQIKSGENIIKVVCDDLSILGA